MAAVEKDFDKLNQDKEQLLLEQGKLKQEAQVNKYTPWLLNQGKLKQEAQVNKYTPWLLNQGKLEQEAQVNKYTLWASSFVCLILPHY